MWVWNSHDRHGNKRPLLAKDIFDYSSFYQLFFFFFTWPWRQSSEISKPHPPTELRAQASWQIHSNANCHEAPKRGAASQMQAFFRCFHSEICVYWIVKKKKIPSLKDEGGVNLLSMHRSKTLYQSVDVQSFSLLGAAAFRLLTTGFAPLCAGVRKKVMSESQACHTFNLCVKVKNLLFFVSRMSDKGACSI